MLRESVSVRECRLTVDLVDLDRIDRVEKAVAVVETDPLQPISEVAEAVALSHRHLDKEFARPVELSPRTLSRLLRVRRLLDQLGPGDDQIRRSDEAARHGWYDKVHMLRDFE